MTKISKTVHNVGEKSLKFKRVLHKTPLIEVGIYKLKQGEYVKNHFHETKDESYFILSGKAEVIISSNEKICLNKNEHIFIGKMIYHSVRNAGKSDLVFTIHHIENILK